MSIHSLIEHKGLLLPHFCLALNAISVTLGLKCHPFFQAKKLPVLKNSREKKSCARKLTSSPASSKPLHTWVCNYESVSHFRFKSVFHNSHKMSSVPKYWPECTSYLLPELLHWPLLCYNNTIKNIRDAQAKWIKPLHSEGGIQKMLCCWKQHAEDKAALLWHANLTCSPPAQKDQIPRRDMWPKNQGCDLRVYLETKWMQGCAMDTLPMLGNAEESLFPAVSCEIKWNYYQQAFLNQMHMPHRCEWMGSTVARARPPLLSHALAPPKWCHFPSKVCTDNCFITSVMMALYPKT